MTYQELLALINPANAVTRTDGYSSMGDTPGYSTTSAVPDWYYADPSNPLGGAVQDLGGGALSYWLPRDTMSGDGGQDVTQYGANGQVDNQWFAQNTQNWQDTLRGMVGTIGGAALLGNAGALLGGAGAAGTGAVAPAAPETAAFTFASPEAAQAAATWGSGGAAEVAGGAGASALSGGVAPAATSVAPAATGAIGSTGAGMGAWGEMAGVPGMDVAGAPATAAGGTDWMSRLRQGGSVASSLLGGGPGVAALLGGAAGILGNDNMQNTQTGSSGLASWMMPYAQDVVARQQFMANQPATNWALDTSQGLLGNYALNGTPLTNAAMQQQQNVIGGGMLGSNPYIDQVAQNIGNRMGEAYATGTRAGTFSRFNNDGNSVTAKSAFGQTLGNNDRAFADSLGSTMSNLYYGNYQNERAAQDAAARGSTGLANFGVQNAGLLGQSGADAWQRPYTQLSNYQNSLSPAFGTQKSETQNIQAPNNWMAGLGGAALGTSIYRQLYPTTKA